MLQWHISSMGHMQPACVDQPLRTIVLLIPQDSYKIRVLSMTGVACNWKPINGHMWAQSGDPLDIITL